MLLYPPFQTIHPKWGGALYGYDWIFTNSANVMTVNIGVLLTQWIGVLIIGGLAYLVLKK
jgi:hypothetical protein